RRLPARGPRRASVREDRRRPLHRARPAAAAAARLFPQGGDAAVSQRRACVIGHPVAHARSPVLHRYWLQEYGIDGDYAREDVAPENIRAFLKNLGKHGYVGANITVPHKAAAFLALDHAEPVAETLKVANTIWLQDGALHGTNTDVHGFLANLDETVHSWDMDAEQAVVLGAGGGARAVV